jgi:hypothetical protein
MPPVVVPASPTETLFVAGFPAAVEPTHKFPEASNLAASVPPSLNPMMSAPKKMPVLASVPRIAGVAADPSISERPSVPLKIKVILRP